MIAAKRSGSVAHVSLSDGSDPAASNSSAPILTSDDASSPHAGVAGEEASTGSPAGEVPLEPLPYDGVASVAVGTVLWAIASVIGLVLLDDLRADGHLWWLATALCGCGLGLLGLWVVLRRRNRLRAVASGQASSRSSSAAR